MTVRSVVLGLAGALFVCGLSFLNDRVLRNTFLVGNNMPVSVYGLLMLLVMFVNPLLKRLALTGRELAVALALTLAACCVPGAGLLRSFTSSLVLPHHFKKSEPGWEGTGPVEFAPVDVVSLPRVAAILGSRGGEGEPDPGSEVASRMPEALRERLLAAPPGLPDGRDGIDDRLLDETLAALNALLDNPVLAGSPAFEGVAASGWLERLRRTPRSGLGREDLRRLNRGLIDIALGGAVRPWRPGVVEQVPARMLADVEGDDRVLGGFVQGMGDVDRHIGFGEVPWGGWARTLAFWLPMVLFLWGGLAGLSVVVHRQWSRHEQLHYPVAGFADALLPEEGRAFPAIFRNRLFWIALGAVLVIDLNNYAYQWSPQHLVQLPTWFDFSPLARLLPTFERGGGTRLFMPTIYFSVIGIAYLLPKDVSLSFGVGPFLFAVLAGALAGVGVSLDGTVEGSSWYIGVKPSTFLLFGANVAVFGSLVYQGRRTYATVFKRSLGLATADEPTPAEVWGCRAFMAFTGLFILHVAYLAGTGLVLAALYAALMVIMFVVMSRLMCEAGLFYIQPYFFPCVVLWGLFGAKAIGPGTLLVMQVMTMVLAIDPREALMPFASNSLKLLELRKERIGRASLVGFGALLLGLAVALPLTLYIQYDQGSAIWEGWAEESVPRMPFRNAMSVQNKLTAQGALTASEAASGTARLGMISPNAVCMWAMLFGTVATLAFAFARLRWSWWPLHPLMFVTWGTEPLRRICVSFLLGWLVKALVTKYGGGSVFTRLKPLMIGLIAGEVLGAFVPAIIGAVYWMATGLPPKPFHVMPG